MFLWPCCLDVASAPEWIKELLRVAEANPRSRWTDAELRARDIDPLRLRRWFKQHFGMTFHAYIRTRRLGIALGQIADGDTLDNTAFDSGYESLSGFRDALKKHFKLRPVKPLLALYCSIDTCIHR
jgi:AraC family transcriptional regulator of adaptative response/methylated-DNA-[protein]-cysteine methyltransferase